MHTRGPGQMTRGFRIGTVRDVDVVIDGALLVVALPIAWMFAASAKVALPWLARPVVALLGTFASATVLGLAVVHAVVWALASRALGLALGRVVVLPAGALVDLEAGELRPSDELAALGVASFVTALVALAGCAVVALASDPVVVTLASWTVLGASAVVLASALPGYPLAGGRVVRAVAVSSGMSIERSTRVAALVGHGLGLVLVAGGVFLSLSSGGARAAAGAVLAFTGWSIAQAAGRGHERVRDEMLAARHRAEASSGA